MRSFVLAATVLAGLQLGAFEAWSQSINIIGNWACRATVSGGAGKAAALRFRVTLLRSGRFRARGIAANQTTARQKPRQFRFVAQGDWRIVRARGGRALAMLGTMRPPNGPIASPFTFGSYIRGPRAMSHRRAKGGRTVTSQCRR